MLQYAQKCAHTTNSSPFFSDGESLFLNSQLTRCSESGITLPCHFFQTTVEENDNLKKKVRKMSKFLSQNQHQIFLGGSCNPTTWRQDEAIPLLKNLGISFYNPQVTTWKQELIEQEHQAKENASVLFYVIDNRTRNVACFIEAAHFAGSRRTLVLVVNPYKGPGHSINGESITDQEYNDLRNSLDLLKDLMQKQGIPTFETIPTAVNRAAEIVQSSCITTKDREAVDDKLTSLFQQTFNALDKHNCGSISLDDVCIAFRHLFHERISINDIENVISNTEGSETMRITFEEFCSILGKKKPVEKFQYSYDLCLTGDGSSWKDNIAIPLLRKHGLTYFIPENDSSEYFRSLYSSRVHLFCIPEDTRGLSTMTKAAFAIGFGSDAVLCIQSIHSDSKMNGFEQLSEQALNDYNRGRIYLMDLAKRDNIPVCNDVEESLLLAICKIHQSKSPS